MTDDATLIAEHIARHGVTLCPPATYSQPIDQDLGNWKDQRAATFAVRQRRMRFEAAARKTGTAAPTAFEVARDAVTKARQAAAEARRATVLRLVREGMGSTDMAEQLGVSVGTISLDLTTLRAAGEAIPSLRTAGHRRRERAAKLSSTGGAQ